MSLCERYDVTKEAKTVTSSEDFYKPGSYPYDIRLVMSPATKDMQEFAVKFFKLQAPFGSSYQAQIVIRTDGSAWKITGFDDYDNNPNLALKQGVTIPSPESDGLYRVDLLFTGEGLKVKINGLEVIEIQSDNLATEIKGWDDSISDVGMKFDPVLSTLRVQVSRSSSLFIHILIMVS